MTITTPGGLTLPSEPETPVPNYKFDEYRLLEDIREYINSTYKKHYSGEDGVQAIELTFSSGNGTGFNIGSIIKYAARYGKKSGYNRDDLMKIVHYALLQLYVHDKFIS